MVATILAGVGFGFIGGLILLDLIVGTADREPGAFAAIVIIDGLLAMGACKLLEFERVPYSHAFDVSSMCGFLGFWIIPILIVVLMVLIKRLKRKEG